MATITVEDGTGKANATSYVSEADFNTYIGERGNSLGGENGDATQVLIKAMDYLETLNFRGSRSSRTQALLWPRYDVVLDGVELLSSDIPQELINAQCIIAYEIDQGNDPQSLIDRATKREKVDVVEIEYQDNASSAPQIRKVINALAKLIAPGSSPINFRVGRG